MQKWSYKRCNHVSNSVAIAEAISLESRNHTCARSRCDPVRRLQPTVPRHHAPMTPPSRTPASGSYRSRILDGLLRHRLASQGAVLIEGPRACGKTTTARQFAASEVLLDIDEDARQAAEVEPSLVLQGPTPRLIDEWQLEPKIWNHLRREVDDRGEVGQFILTGSAVPADDITRHTGAGRISRLEMRPMTLYELGHSSGTVSVADLLDGIFDGSREIEFSLHDLAEFIAAGGWPGHLGRDSDAAVQAMRDYVEELCRSNVSRVGDKKRDPDRVRRLLRSLARNTGTYAAATTLAEDTGGAEEAISARTAREYVTALERLRIVEVQPPWSTHLRSKSRLRRSPKWHFVDPSLAVACLGAMPERLLEDMNLFGFLYESLVTRDLRVYAQAADASVYQYRDNTGLEVDAIVEAVDGRWAAFEIKLGKSRVDEAAEDLLKFENRVDTTRAGEPAMLGVVVSSGYGYRRDDGVAVIPLGSLGP